MRRLLFLIAVIFFAVANAAQAGSVAQPGSTAGLAVGAPRAEGIYFENTSSYGQRTSTPNGLGVNLTQGVWATPFRVYGAQLQLFAMQPTNYRTNTANDSFYPGPTYLAARLARALGDGFGISYQAGFRAAQPSQLTFRQNSFDQRGAITYNANGFNLTANLLNGLFFVDPAAALHPNWLNLDLTASKRFGSLEIGAVAFGSTDISRPAIPVYRREGQIAVGALAGYDFGSFRFQTFVTRDVARRGYTGYDTRGWTRLIVPLYTPSAMAEPLQARY